MLRKIHKILLGNFGTKNEFNRNEWLEKTLLNIPKGQSILDAGAGELKYKNFCSHLKYVSQDFAQYDGGGNNEGLQVGDWDPNKVDIISDITDIPVEEESFDAIMCVEVLEHLPEPIKAIEEFSRVLKQGGRLILTTPFSSLTHFAPYYFSNGFSKYWYEAILPKYGFEIIELTYNGNYFSYIAQEMRRLRGVVKSYSRFTPLTSFFLNIFSFGMLRLLTSFDKKDKNSNELLCHGINVVALKK